ncbi:MAG TPA: DNA-directed RNA polymerase subunit omega [Thermoanaerobacterales bacterium]|jgi:DNA-directed RNA polymerase subunit omega|nr:DNA-directed RNA polymerase subunit omega [Thermoanaerobacterales bacterium]
MIYPSIDTLVDKYDSKYTVAVAAAKRARQIVEGAKPLTNVSTEKPVSIALIELEAGKIIVESPVSGIK